MFGSALLRCELARDGVRGFGSGIGCSGMILMTWDGCRQVRIGQIGVGMVTVVTEPLHEDVARVQVPEPHLPPNHPTWHPACHWVSAWLNHSNSCMTLISIKYSSSAEDHSTYIRLLCSGRSCKNGATG